MDRLAGWFRAIHSSASSKRRSKSPRLLLKRWSDAFTIQSFFGSFACCSVRWTSATGTNSSWVEWIAASGSGATLPDNGRGAECRLVRHAVCHVDQRILPSPAKLVDIGQAKRHHPRNGHLRLGIGGREDRQPGTLGHANQGRLPRRTAGRVVREDAVVSRFVLQVAASNLST